MHVFDRNRHHTVRVCDLAFLFVCLSLSASVSVFVCLDVPLSVSLSAPMYVCMSVSDSPGSVTLSRVATKEDIYLRTHLRRTTYDVRTFFLLNSPPRDVCLNSGETKTTKS